MEYTVVWEENWSVAHWNFPGSRKALWILLAYCSTHSLYTVNTCAFRLSVSASRYAPLVEYMVLKMAFVSPFYVTSVWKTFCLLFLPLFHFGFGAEKKKVSDQQSFPQPGMHYPSTHLLDEEFNRVQTKVKQTIDKADCILIISDGWSNIQRQEL